MACARYANIFQHLVVNLPEQIDVEIVGLESIGILGEINRLQPFAAICGPRSYRELLQQRLGLLQIERVEAFGEPAINRSQQFASLLHLALVAPEEAAQDRYLATNLRPRISG